MKSTAFLYVTISIVFFFNACNEKLSYDNPSDPAGQNFTHRVLVERQLIITDFDGDSSRSVWGWDHYASGKGGGTIIKSFTDEASVDNRVSRVLQLDYEANPDSAHSGGLWFQYFGEDDPQLGILTFNPAILGVTSLSFYARGDKGGEILQVVFVDIKDAETFPSVDLQLTTTWMKYKIPLQKLAAGSIDFSRLIVLEIHVGENPKKGRVFIDELAFQWD